MKSSALADTGILFAVPVNRTQFQERVQNSDWLGKFLVPDASAEELQTAIDERWRDTYSPLVAEPLQEVAEQARSAGVDVRIGATLADLASMTSVRRTVIVFAHWKGPEIVFDDLVQPWKFEAFLNRAAASRTAMGLWIHAQLRKRLSRQHTDTLLDVLNDALDAVLPNSAEDAGPVFEHAVTRQARRREEMEAEFSEILRPGNRLEMFDGLHTKEAVEAAVATDFDGVLDLTACTSTVLADYLAARRRQALRTVQFPMVVEFVWAAKAVAGALQLTATGNFEYLEAREVAANILNEVIQELRRGD